MPPHAEQKIDVLIERLENTGKRLDSTNKQIDKLWGIIGDMEERYVTRAEFSFVKTTLISICSGSVVALFAFLIQHH